MELTCVKCEELMKPDSTTGFSNRVFKNGLSERLIIIARCDKCGARVRLKI